MPDRPRPQKNPDVPKEERAHPAMREQQLLIFGDHLHKVSHRIMSIFNEKNEHSFEEFFVSARHMEAS